jgi:hypothetical protein
VEMEKGLPGTPFEVTAKKPPEQKTQIRSRQKSISASKLFQNSAKWRDFNTVAALRASQRPGGNVYRRRRISHQTLVPLLASKYVNERESEILGATSATQKSMAAAATVTSSHSHF